MISFFQKIDTAIQTNTSGHDIQFFSNNTNDAICLDIAIKMQYITANSGGISSFTPTGRFELNRLLKERDALQREKQLIKHSWVMLIVSSMMLISSVIYFAVTTWALWNPVRPDVHNVIIVPHHKQHDVPKKNQRRHSQQRNNNR